jgi:putative transposase
MLGGKHMATRQYEHTTTSEFFEDWFKNELLPRVPKGYTIIMDNARFHRKSQLYLLAVEARVKLLFLPPYSPDFNPIEHGWANLKRWLRDNMAYWGCPVLAINEYFWWNEYSFYY